MTQAQSRRESPRSAVRILQILEKLSDESEEWSLASLSRELGTPKSSLLILLRGLTEMGHIQHSSGTYKLGGAAFRLASLILSNRHFPEAARPILNEIVKKTGETAVIGILSEDDQFTIYVDKVESPSALRFSTKIGDRRALYASASGHVMLAFGDQRKTAAYLRNVKISPLTPHSISTKKELKQAIETTRLNGVAITHNQVTEGITGFGAPIFGESGELLGALSLAAPSIRIEKRITELSNLAKKTAADISNIMGYQQG